MKLQEIRDLARDLNLKPDGLSKSELIKSIQRHEGNFDCYGTASHGFCDQRHCLWLKDCLAASGK